MGLVSNFLSASTSVDHTLPIDPLDRRAYRELQKVIGEGDLTLPASMEASNQAQMIMSYDGSVTGGDFTLKFTLASGEVFTTAAIVFDAVDTVIKTAIDDAATAAGIVGWINGDILVEPNGSLDLIALKFTFDGDSVKEQNHALIVLDDAGLTGGGSGGAITVVEEGQANRPGYAILMTLGILTGTLPAEGVAPVALVAAATPGERRLSAETIRAVALDIAITEGNNSAIYEAIIAAAGV